MSDRLAYMHSDEQFTRMPNAVLFMPGLSDRAIRLYLVLAHYVTMEYGAIPSRRVLADHLGLSSLTPVDRALAELKEAGLLKVERRHADSGGRTSSRYHLGTPANPPGPSPRVKATPTMGGAHAGGHPLTTSVCMNKTDVNKTEVPPKGAPRAEEPEELIIDAELVEDDAPEGELEQAPVLLAPPGSDMEPGAFDDEDRKRDRLLAQKMRTELIERGSKRPFTVDEKAVSAFADMRALGYSHRDLWWFLAFIRDRRYWGSKVRTPQMMRRRIEELGIEATQAGYSDAARGVPPGGQAVPAVDDRQTGWAVAAERLQAMGVQ